VDVPPEIVVVDEPGHRVGLGERRVDPRDDGGLIPSPDVAHALPCLAHLLQLARISIDAAGELPSAQEVAELLGRRQLVLAAFRGARDGVEQRREEDEVHLGVMGEKHLTPDQYGRYCHDRIQVSP
jgi:hypothetical protein